MGCVAATCSGSPEQRTAVRARETVLLLHGSAGSGSLWRNTAKALSPLYRCLAPDLIGYGKSGAWPSGTNLTVEDEYDAVKALLACCAETYHVVGYSYGGIVALQAALSGPARVRTLTLIEPVFFNALHYTQETDALCQFVQISKDFEAAFQRGGAESALGPFIEFWAGTGSWDLLPSSARAEMLKVAGKISLDWRAAFAFAPDRQDLARLGRRTLLIRGTDGPQPMVRLVDALHSLMPGSTRLVVEGANHLLPLTHADAIIAALRSHLHADAGRGL